LRRLYLYCQRLAAKNETTSFFGPLAHGVVAPEARGLDLGPEVPGGVRQLRGFVSFWAVCALARRIGADPTVRASVPGSRVSASRVSGRRVTLPTGRVVELPEKLARVAAAVDGSRPQSEIALATGLEMDRVSDALATLERLGAVRAWPE